MSARGLRLAGAMTLSPRLAALAVAGLLILRLVMAAWLPLSADEAYYWLWSKHLAAGYYDHPPAIALVIRAGTLLFGDTPLGVRLGGVLLSGLATWFIWRSADMILEDRKRAALAALLFNLTLMIGVEMLAATPDTLSVTWAAAFLFCLAKAQKEEEPRWWLAAGIAGGVGLLSKYAGFFIGAGGLFWLVAGTRARPALKTPWPWAGAFLALLVFLPNLWWQVGHHWMTFQFQFGRIGAGHWTLRYLVEFFGAQLGLATPFLFALMVLGLLRAAKSADPRFLLFSLAAPAIAYFLFHALHDRVQGNWPCFLYPMLAILAADAFGRDPRLIASRLAMPVAALFLLAAYAQAATGFLPLKADPLARLLGIGMDDVTARLEALKNRTGARAILADDYEMTSWLRFYDTGLPVIAMDQPDRYLEAPRITVEGPALYVADRAPDRTLLGNFAQVERLSDLIRIRRSGSAIARYKVWLLDKPQRPLQGRSP